MYLNKYLSLQFMLTWWWCGSPVLVSLAASCWRSSWLEALLSPAAVSSLPRCARLAAAAAAAVFSARMMS